MTRKLKRAKRFSKLRLIAIMQEKLQDKVVELTTYDIPQIVQKMSPYWAGGEINSEIREHFSLPNISLGVKKDGDLKCFILMIYNGYDMCVTALYTDNSMKYKRKIYELHKKLMNEFDDIKLYYMSNQNIFQNHTYKEVNEETGEELKWVVL